MPRWFLQGERKGSDTPYGDEVSCGKYAEAEGDGAKLYYEVYGEGAPLFILHGGGVGCAYEMGSIIDKLREEGKHKIVVVATRGHGRSELGREKMSFEQRAKDVASIIRKEVPSGTRVAFIGFSDGGYSALALAVHYPELVERVATIGVGTVKPGAYNPEVNVEDWCKFDPAFAEHMKNVMPEFGRWQEFASDYMGFWSKQSLGRGFFGRVSCPVLLIAGDEDDHAPLQTVVDAYMMIPHSRLSIIPKAWHTCFLDNFDATWDAIKPFVMDPIESLQPSKKSMLPPVPEKVESTELLHTSTSWDGADLPKYPEGKPEVIVKRIIIPPHTRLDWHSHDVMSYAIVEHGDLTLFKRDSSDEKTFHSGEVFAELVGTVHTGENRGDEPVELIVVYPSAPGVPLSVLAPQ